MIYDTEVKRIAKEDNNSSDNYEEVVVKVQKILKVNYNFYIFELFFLSLQFIILLDRLPRQSAKYALMIGAGVGLITGGLQDVIRYKQGQKIWYLEKK